MNRRFRPVVHCLFALVLGLSLLTWPAAMGRAETRGGMMASAHSGHHHQNEPGAPHHRSHLTCCDLCLIACSAWTVRTSVPNFERLGDNIRYEPTHPRRLTPIAWPTGPELPLPLGPPQLSA